MWSNDILSIIYTRVKIVSTPMILKRYSSLSASDLNFTTEASAQTVSKFPTIFFAQIPGGETGGTFDQTVNAVNFIVQIEVIHNTSQMMANGIADIISDVMKDMYFKITGDPVQDNSDPKTKRNIARYSRVVGHGDGFFKLS